MNETRQRPLIKTATLLALLACVILAGANAEVQPDPRKPLQDVLAKGDANGDGHYSETELLETLKVHRDLVREELRARAAEEGRTLPEPPVDHEIPSIEEGAARMMDRLDRDRDGLLSLSQVEFGLKKMRRRAESLYQKQLGK